MTMTISAAEFKSRCLAILDEVAKTGNQVTVTKRGRPVARLVPLEGDVPDLTGSVKYRKESDLIDPVETTWDADR